MEGVLHLFQDPTFWVAFVTVVFAIVVFKPIRSALVSMMDQRVDAIRLELEEANKIKDEANALLAEAERRIAKSEEEAKEIVSHARSEAENIISSTKAKLSKDVETRKKMALQKIQAFEDAAIEDIKAEISGIVVSSAQTILEENIDEEAFQNLIDDSLEKISKTVH